MFKCGLKKDQYLTVTKAESISIAVRIHVLRLNSQIVSVCMRVYIHTHNISAATTYNMHPLFGSWGGFIFQTTGHGHSYAYCVTIPLQFRYSFPSRLEPCC